MNNTIDELLKEKKEAKLLAITDDPFRILNKKIQSYIKDWENSTLFNAKIKQTSYVGVIEITNIREFMNLIISKTQFNNYWKKTLYLNEEEDKYIKFGDNLFRKSIIKKFKYNKINVYYFDGKTPCFIHIKHNIYLLLSAFTYTIVK